MLCALGMGVGWERVMRGVWERGRAVGLLNASQRNG